MRLACKGNMKPGKKEGPVKDPLPSCPLAWCSSTSAMRSRCPILSSNETPALDDSGRPPLTGRHRPTQYRLNGSWRSTRRQQVFRFPPPQASCSTRARGGYCCPQEKSALRSLECLIRVG